MSRFHDEFFKQNGSGHDELVMRCFEKEISDQIASLFIKNEINTTETKNIWICNCGGRDGAGRIAHVTNPLHSVGRCKYTSCIYSGECKTGGCEHWITTGYTSGCLEKCDEGATCRYKDVFNNNEKKTTANGVDFISSEVIVSELEKKDLFEVRTCKYKYRYIDSIHNFQPEVIVRGRGSSFILGYIDLILEVKRKFAKDLEIDHNWVWKNSGSHEDTDGDAHNNRIIIEVKPEVKDLGAVIRQIKTYKDNTAIVNAVLVTYSILTASQLSYLDKSGIRTLILSKGAGVV